jgi:hypothetical protein
MSLPHATADTPKMCAGCGEVVEECDCAIIHAAVDNFRAECPELFAQAVDTREREWRVQSRHGSGCVTGGGESSAPPADTPKAQGAK